MINGYLARYMEPYVSEFFWLTAEIIAYPDLLTSARTPARKALILYVNEEVKPTCANSDIYPSRLNWCHCLYPVDLNNTDAIALCQLVRTFFYQLREVEYSRV